MYMYILFSNINNYKISEFEEFIVVTNVTLLCFNDVMC